MLVERVIEMEDYKKVKWKENVEYRTEKRMNNSSEPRTKHKRSKVSEKKDQKHNGFSKSFTSFTPLNTLRDQILMEIKDRNLLRYPMPLKSSLNTQDRSKYLLPQRPRSYHLS